MPKAAQIDAPQSLNSFFPDSSDSEDEQTAFDPCYETQTVEVNGEHLLVRQYAFHSHNANRVWPGTFNLLDYLLKEKQNTRDKIYERNWGSVLELGAATGLLAIRLSLDCYSNFEHEHTENDHRFICTDIITSDVQDEHGEIEENVKHNFESNGFVTSTDNQNRDVKGIIPVHIPHTWGAGWRSAAAKYNLQNKTFDTIIASDILLYVSAYSDLVATLVEIFDVSKERNPIFIMSWNRRMKESNDFFDMMKNAGFNYNHEGKCIYTFKRQYP